MAGWATAAVTVAAIVGAGVAFASAQSRDDVTVAPGSVGSATAKCKPGRSALAGGFASQFDSSSSSKGPLVRYASMPAGSRGIETDGANFSGSDGQLASFAYCGVHAPQIVSKRVQLFPSSYGNALARCPSGTEAIAGGFATNKFDPDKGPRIIAFTSRRAGERKWRVGGFNIGGKSGPGSSGRLIAYAYCSSAAQRIITRSETVEVDPNAEATVDAGCPSGSRALSGGFDGHFGIGSSDLKASIALTSKRIDHGLAWRTAAFGIANQPAAVTGYVYCRR
ncbi:MAG: hypothetical protein ACRDK1_05105 [Solirubrobacterales bacterium]